LGFVGHLVPSCDGRPTSPARLVKLQSLLTAIEPIPAFVITDVNVRAALVGISMNGAVPARTDTCVGTASRLTGGNSKTENYENSEFHNGYSPSVVMRDAPALALATFHFGLPVNPEAASLVGCNPECLA